MTLQVFSMSIKDYEMSHGTTVGVANGYRRDD
jgi:hypothetical protein